MLRTTATMRKLLSRAWCSWYASSAALHPVCCACLCFLACCAYASLQIDVYEVAGSRFAELPSELYDVALAYIADAAANGQPEQLERALGALTAAARATPPGATGQVGGGVCGGAATRAVTLHAPCQRCYVPS